MKKINSQHYKTTKWSGGATTELLIYPKESNFKAQDFQYRLSIATIEVSSSDFTPLPNVNRTLLLLAGELKLIHENHHESFLMPFSQDSFMGDWNTHSIGIAKDFNLMTRGTTKGTIQVLSNDHSFTSDADHIICYNYDGEISINKEDLLVNETMIIQNLQKQLDVEVDGKLIVVEIFL
jgi:environmental stress-induced protein Ves